jgi:hypothetical protein
MKTARFTTGTIVLGLLLLVASPVAAQLGTVTAGRAFNFDQPQRGFVRIAGEFEWDVPLDLGSAATTVTVIAALSEDAHGELVSGLPVTLHPRTSSARVAVFETKPGTLPLYRLTVRTCVPSQEGCPNSRGLDVGEYQVLFEVVNADVERPTCPEPPGPDLTVAQALLVIDDGVHVPAFVILEAVWKCIYRGGRVQMIQAQ